MSSYPKSSATEIAQAALQLATSRPELVFRNPQKIEQGWQGMREDRAAFVEFCGGDELVLQPAEAEALLNAYYRHRQEAAVAGQPDRARGRRLPGLDLPFFELPPELAGSDTIGVIYDQVDGLNFYADYGMLRDLFADPALGGRRQHQDLLRTYLREESIGPLPIRRLATAHPETADTVFRKLLRKPVFTWSEDGESLLRRRKPWYYAHEPRPGVSVIGDRLGALAMRPSTVTVPTAVIAAQHRAVQRVRPEALPVFPGAGRSVRRLPVRGSRARPGAPAVVRGTR